MREYKFRGYDAEIEKMTYFDDEDYILQYGDILRQHIDDYDDFGNPEFAYESVKDKVKLMQYTGLKDKNGKEIYEGDIVKSYYYIPNQDGTEGERYVVKLINYNETLCKYNIDMFENLEIIGNMWDNPELLEKGE